ncbi:MAG: hypothetical protein AAF614_26815 [Chloroflexota bacterium]
MQKLDRYLSDYLIILVILILATIVMTWPLAATLGTQIPGSEGDAWEHLWTFRWVKEALISQSDIFYTNQIFYPQGTSLATHNFAWLHILLWLPLQAIFGEGAAYSLLFLSTFVFNGFAVYLLVFTLTGQKLAGILSGFIAAFWPNILSHHDHPNLIVTAWVALTLLAIYHVFQTNHWRYAVLGGIFLALTGITRWQSLVLGGIAIVLYYLFQVSRQRLSAKSKQIITNALIINGIALLVMLPLLLKQFASAANLGTTIEGVASSGGQSDLLAYFLPNRFHPWWGSDVFDLLYDSLQTNKVFVAFLGYTTLILMGLSLLYARKQVRFWVGLAVVYILLALGGELLINGQGLFPLPYRLIESTFLGALIRTPDRFNVFLSIPIAVLAGFGAKVILERGRNGENGRLRHLLVATCMLFILVEYAVRFPTLPLHDFSNWYNILAQEEGEFAILEWPMSDKSYDEDYMQYQSIHHKPIVGGSVARPVAESYAFVEQLPALKGRSTSKAAPQDVVNVGSQLNALANSNVKYLVFHKQLMNDQDLQSWQNWLHIDAIYEDDKVLVYKTDLTVGRDTSFTPLTFNGLGIIESSVEPRTVLQGQPLDIHIRWGTKERLTEPFTVCFRLVDTVGRWWQSDCSELSAVWLTEMWERNEMVDGNYQITPSPYLTNGTYRLIADVSGSYDDYSIMLGYVQLEAQARTFAHIPAEKLVAQWENRIGLTDYQFIQATSQQIQLNLSWSARQRMGSYKLFIHLVDEETDEIVAQVDTVPRNWTYPTSWWEKGEIIEETIALTLEEPLQETKQYSLWLGFYDPDTGERLTVQTDNPKLTVEMDRLKIQQFSSTN